MNALIIDQPAKMHREADSNSPVIAELAIGGEVALGAVKKQNGKDWVAATLTTGQQGYLPGATRIYQIQQAALLQASVTVHAAPSAQSAVITQYQQNAIFNLTGTVNQNDKNWVRIRDTAGHEGYIDGATKIKLMNKPSPAGRRAAGSKNMLVGALWCIGGIIVTTVTYSAASNGGGTYFVAWGAILFGGIQFLQGMIQLLTASD